MNDPKMTEPIWAEAKTKPWHPLPDPKRGAPRVQTAPILTLLDPKEEEHDGWLPIVKRQKPLPM